MSWSSFSRQSSLNWGLALSLLLHVLFAIISQIDSIPDFSIHFPEPTMEVELVREEPKPPPPPPQPEPPRPPPQAQTNNHPGEVPTPQLRPGKLAEKSLAPKQPSPAPGVSFERKPPAQTIAVGDLSQTAQDMVLSQVLKLWRFNTDGLKGSNFTISMFITINRDGTIGGALHKDAPWNPKVAIPGYDKITDTYGKHALESMLLALKMSQPLQLPPDDGKGWPRRMTIQFRPGDL